jgi:uncharacterized protein
MRLVPGRRFALVALVLLVACSGSNTPTPGNCSPDPAIVRVGSNQLTVSVADDEATRERGLMGVTSLPADEGMAFVFDGPTTGTFWMKNTLIPLSIAFVGADGLIVSTLEMTPCEAEPCPTYSADAPYTTAIEANAGWFADHGINTGDEVRLDRHLCS